MQSFIDTSETWVKASPKKGDHIRVQRLSGLYAHHGVYVSDKEVIHFTGDDDDSVLDWSKCEVIVSDLDFFLKGGELEVKVYSDDELEDLYPPDSIVSYARSCIGDGGYHLAFNNCEHFANVCTLGRFRSLQVERVIQGKLPNDNNYSKEDMKMGFFGRIGSFVSGLFGGGGSKSRTVENYTYEPDKVKVAEIEASTQRFLANKEKERIELVKNARLELLEFETRSEAALMQARIEKNGRLIEQLLKMQERMNEIAQKRLEILVSGSMDIIKDMENFYSELEQKIKDDMDYYETEKLPKLLSILENYQPGTASYEIYKNQIDDDRKQQLKLMKHQIKAISERQNMVLQSINDSKNRITDQTSEIVTKWIEGALNQHPEMLMAENIELLPDIKSKQTFALLEKNENDNTVNVSEKVVN